MTTIIVTAIITFALLQLISHFKHKKLEKRIKCLEPAIVIRPLKTENIRKAVESPPEINKSIGLDSTKRKSLQPSNQNIIPAGFKELYRNVDGDVIAFLEKRMPIEFQHNFFGSSLIVEGYTVFSGMTNKLHIMEVDENNNVTIDGAPRAMHPDVIEKIREQARAK